MRKIAVLLAFALIFGVYAAVLAAQAATGAVPSRAAVTLRLDVLPSTAAFRRADPSDATGLRAEGSRILLEATQPGELLVQVWKLRKNLGAEAGGRDRDLVVSAPVRLEQDSTGRASGTVPRSMARALEAAAARPEAYTVVVVY